MIDHAGEPQDTNRRFVITGNLIANNIKAGIGLMGRTRIHWKTIPVQISWKRCASSSILFTALWSTPCSGATYPGDETYKGPSAGSEPEVQVIMALSEDRRFARVVDYHSYGREVLWGYATCSVHPFALSFLKPEAIAFSNASGYVGANRQPSADGEHYEWQLGNYMNMANLIETHTSFQPSFASAQSEANLLWPGIVWMLQRPMPISGHVTDALTGQPLAAKVKLTPINFTLGEKNSSGGPFGRYYAYVPPGTYTLEVSAPCYQTYTQQVSATAGNATVVNVALQPGSTPTVYCTSKPASIPGCVPTLSFSGVPSVTAGSGFTVTASPVPGAKQGLWVHTTQGQAVTPIQNAFGYLCIKTNNPVIRLAPGSRSWPLLQAILVAGGASAGCGGLPQWWRADPDRNGNCEQ